MELTLTNNFYELNDDTLLYITGGKVNAYNVGYTIGKYAGIGLTMGIEFIRNNYYLFL